MNWQHDAPTRYYLWLEKWLIQAWMDENKTKIGYNINFRMYFCKFKWFQPMENFKADILDLEQKTVETKKWY